MKWVITGGLGFIGANLVLDLLEDPENSVTVVDDMSGAVLHPKDLERDLPFWHIAADVRDRNIAQVAAAGADVIVHLAAQTGVPASVADPLLDFDVNVGGIIAYLDAAKECGVKTFIFASSSAAVGGQPPPLHERMVPQPISPYGAAKLAGEGYCSAYNAAYQVRTVALRFSNVYGPMSSRKGSVVAKFIKQALDCEPMVINGNGGQTRDFIYVRDIVSAIKCAAKGAEVNGVFQIATGRETSVYDVAHRINKLLALVRGKTPINFSSSLPCDVPRSSSNIQKAQSVLLWSPTVSLEDGLSRTVNWFLSNKK